MESVDQESGEIHDVPPHAVHVDVNAPAYGDGIGGAAAPDPFAAPSGDDLQPLNMAAMTGDVTGKGKRLKLRSEPKAGGARLSKNAKTLAVFAGAVVFGGIMVGILTAGQHPHAKTDADAANSSDAPGLVPADVSQMQKAAGHLYAPPVAASMPAIHASMPGPAVSPLTPGQTIAEAPANPQALTPAQKYRNWLDQQHYKQLEGQVVAAENALTATTAKSIPAAAVQAGSARSGLPSGGVDAADMLRAALTASQVPGAGQGGGSGNGLGGLLSVLKAQGSALASGGDGTGGEAGNSAFLKAQKVDDADGYLHHSVHAARSPNEVFAGSIIPAALETGINSDLPGDVTALVVQPVYDSINGSTILIPQGTKAKGRYSSAVVYGQQRVLVAWNRLIFPDGQTINLAGMQGTDTQGESGFYDQVDNHYGRIFGSAILMSLLGVGAQLSQPQNSGAFNTPSASAQAAAALATQLDNTGTALLQKNLNIKPTLTERPGYRFDILVNRTMLLPPYRGH